MATVKNVKDILLAQRMRRLLAPLWAVKAALCEVCAPRVIFESWRYG